MTMPAMCPSPRFSGSAPGTTRPPAKRIRSEGGVPVDSWTLSLRCRCHRHFNRPQRVDGCGLGRLAPSLTPADALAQEGVAQRDEVRPLPVVLAVAVAACRRLVEIGLAVAHRLQL